MATLNMTDEDAYMSRVNQPLRTSDVKPIDTQEQVAEINKKTVDGLLNYHDRNAADGYFQSHPYDQMYTSHSLAVDEATLNNNYMKLIFGGKPDPKKDNIHLAYNHTIKQRAEAPITQENTLYTLNASDFVEGATATKDSLLKTFAETRRHFKGQIDSDTERFMKTRAGHELTQVTFYNKNVTPGGQAGRFHHTAGQHGHLQYRPDTKGLTSWWNLSSRTYAPDGDGGEVPLNYQNLHGNDPRTVPITDELRVVAPTPVGEFNLNDLGAYAGKDVDRFVQTHSDNNPSFSALFNDERQRKWV